MPHPDVIVLQHGSDMFVVIVRLKEENRLVIGVPFPTTSSDDLSARRRAAVSMACTLMRLEINNTHALATASLDLNYVCLPAVQVWAAPILPLIPLGRVRRLDVRVISQQNRRAVEKLGLTLSANNCFRLKGKRAQYACDTINAAD